MLTVGPTMRARELCRVEWIAFLPEPVALTCLRNTSISSAAPKPGVDEAQIRRFLHLLFPLLDAEADVDVDAEALVVVVVGTKAIVYCNITRIQSVDVVLVYR